MHLHTAKVCTLTPKSLAVSFGDSRRGRTSPIWMAFAVRAPGLMPVLSVANSDCDSETDGFIFLLLHISEKQSEFPIRLPDHFSLVGTLISSSQDRRKKIVRG